MRLFVSAWPDEVATAALVALGRPSVEGLRWSRPDQWHVTLAFIGAVDQMAARHVSQAIGGLSDCPEVRAVLGPRTELLGPAVLSVPVSGLDLLAHQVRDALERAGHAFDRRRAFRGHCTLARARRGRWVPRSLVGASVGGSWTVRSVDVVESVPAPDGSWYRPISSVGLGTA